MARQKADDSLTYLIFRLLPTWANMLILAGIYVALRFLMPSFLGGNPPLARISITFAPLLTFVAALFALAAELDKHKRRQLLEKQTGLDTIRGMSWQDFERLVGEAYRRQGYRVEETGGGGPDGGVDLILRRDGETAVAQCKRWEQAKVGAPVVRELRGAVARDGATRGIFVTCGEFTAEAVAEARGQPLIELVNGAALLGLVRQAQGQAAPAQTAPAQETPPVPDAPRRSAGLPELRRADGEADRAERRKRRFPVLGVFRVSTVPGNAAGLSLRCRFLRLYVRQGLHNVHPARLDVG